jgi:hypothetical protein
MMPIRQHMRLDRTFFDWGYIMTMHKTGPSALLRNSLVADAVISGATGLMMLFGADFLAGLFAVPSTLLRYAGVSLLPFAALVGMLASRDSIPSLAVRAVIVANVLWVVDSFLLLLTGWVEPSVLGYAFIVGQAVIVAAFAEVQHIGLKTSAQHA